MSIIREKSHLFKEVLNDKNLSLKAKGLWVYLMGLPDDWKISAGEVSRHNTDGIDAVRSGLHELCKQGYVQKIDPQHDENGKFIAGSWVVFESKKPLHD